MMGRRVEEMLFDAAAGRPVLPAGGDAHIPAIMLGQADCESLVARAQRMATHGGAPVARLVSRRQADPAAPACDAERDPACQHMAAADLDDEEAAIRERLPLFPVVRGSAKELVVDAEGGWSAVVQLQGSTWRLSVRRTRDGEGASQQD